MRLRAGASATDACGPQLPISAMTGRWSERARKLVRWICERISHVIAMSRISGRPEKGGKWVGLERALHFVAVAFRVAFQRSAAGCGNAEFHA